MITIEGTIEEIVFSNELNGYTVCDIKYENKLITAVGCMPFVSVGENIKLIGKWTTHPEYGEQLKVDTYEKMLPKTTDSIEKYLSSGIIKGIGPATAARIVSKFGEDTLNVIENDPGSLSKIKGISMDKAIRIGQAFKEQKDLGEVVMFFQEYGISPVCSMKIYKVFGEKTIEEISSNPYKLSDEIFGIGFKTADKIAKNMGIDPSSKYRIRSGIKYVLSQAAANGHTFIPDDRLKEYASQLLDIDIPNINDVLVSLIMDKSVIVEKDGQVSRVYLYAFHTAEIGVCKKLIELASVSFNKKLDDFGEHLDAVQVEEGIILAENQRLAVKEALVNGVMVITGGPGTGKTTIIKSIIKLIVKEGYDVALAAPTGRAAKRMSEATGFEAKTIHRLLEIGFMGTDNEQTFAKNESNTIDAEVIIIDEMSMVDILLMNHLLKAIKMGTRLILVGDVDQLPSVGAGNVLKDIIISGMIKTVKLTEIFRQAEESMIIVNAHRINKGEGPYLNRKDKDFFYLPRSNGNDIVRTLVELCAKRLPDSYGYDPIKHIQVLTPTRKGVVGVANLNLELQKVLNPPHKSKNEKALHGFTFREGDRVMQIKNNYNLRWEKTGQPDVQGEGVFNGDMGIISKIDNEEQRLVVLYEDDRMVEYDFSILDEIEPSYAVTIHKSQGSEFPVVILPLFTGPQILMTRNLLYTAVTRAKNLVILVGLENTLNEMVKNERETLRHSTLADKIKKYMHAL